MEHNKLLRERIELLADVRQHALLIGSYCLTVSTLIESGRDARSPSILANRLEKFEAKVSKIKFGEVSPVDFLDVEQPIKPASTLPQPLRLELEVNGSAVERGLAIQSAVLLAIKDISDVDKRFAAMLAETKIVLPFAQSEKQLPNEWVSERRRILLEASRREQSDDLIEISTNIRHAFRALVEDRIHQADIAFIRKQLDDLRGRAPGK